MHFDLVPSMLARMAARLSFAASSDASAPFSTSCAWSSSSRGTRPRAVSPSRRCTSERARASSASRTASSAASCCLLAKSDAHLAHGLGQLGLRLLERDLTIGAVELDERLTGVHEVGIIGVDRERPSR